MNEAELHESYGNANESNNIMPHVTENCNEEFKYLTLVTMWGNGNSHTASGSGN